jgi:hypothetical protein
LKKLIVLSYTLLVIVGVSLFLAVININFLNNQSYVSAQVLLSIDFGTLFPGQVVTKSFEMSSSDSSTYKVTLIPPSDAEILDMRPLLSLWKDPEEFDTDGPISGAPEYTGIGYFTSPDDLQDKWNVTITIPDITLPDDGGVDYGCEISIEPVELPLPIPSGDLVLRPNGEGDYTNFDFSTGVSHWDMVNDIDYHDDVATYIDNITDNKIDLYNIDDSGLPSGTPIYKITVVAVMKGDSGDRTSGFFGFLSGNTGYWGQQRDLPASYTYFYRAYTQNPYTESDWTVEAIDSLQVGFMVLSDSSSGTGLSATQIYVVVDITP